MSIVKTLKMPPDTRCLDSFSKSEIKSNFRHNGWVNLMNEFLMGTEVFKKENENEDCLNPITVMDVRHKMVKQYSKISPMSREQMHTRAMKLLRTENLNRLRRQRDRKMVDKEIARLKQSFDDHRLLTEKTFDETLKRSNSSVNAPISSNRYTKLRKRMDCANGIYEVDTWVSHTIQMTMETKISPQGIPFDVKVSLKRQEVAEEYLEEVSTRKGSIINDEDEHYKQLSCEYLEKVSTRKGSVIDDEDIYDKQLWKEDEGKTEILKRFFHVVEVQPEASVDEKKEINFRIIPEIQNRINQRIIEHAWMTWKAYIDQLKHRKREKTIYTGKIEAFLSKLQEREKAIINSKKLKHAMSRKEEIRKNIFEKSKIRNKQSSNEKKEEKIKNLMEEIKASRTEAEDTLREIKKTNLESRIKYPNVKFLERMQERKEERAKRRNEIQEKKRLLEEEKENARKQQEDEQKRKKLEELKEKRRLERERMEERKREREKLKLKMSLAESHYRNYLLRSYGLRPWIVLMKMGDAQWQCAVEFFERRVMQKTFHMWADNVRQEVGVKERRALEFHETMLKKNCLRIWMKLRQETLEQNQVAVDWNEFKVIERAFKNWLRFTLDERMEYFNRDNIAVLKYEQKLKMKYLKIMRDYPELKKLEQAKENRKQKWRLKVKEILPDFQPTELLEYS